MSNELSKARQQLSKINSLLKQQKVLPAGQALHDGLVAMIKNPLMKAEREEFEGLLSSAVQIMNNDAGVRKIYPLKLEYQPGAERQLLENIKEMVAAINEATVGDAQEQMALLEQKKQEGLAKGQAHLDNNEYEEAKATFSHLANEHPDDAHLKARIGDSFLKAGFFDDAVNYLADSLELDPSAAFSYNRIGMALRKQHKFSLAEQYYFKALKFIGKDPGILFNLGRLYVDWKQWESAERVATEALNINPDFIEARQLLEYVKKQAAAGQN